MKRVSEVIGGKSQAVLSVSGDTSVHEALALMKEHDIGAVVVLDGDHLAGIFSERDCARKVVLQGRSSKDTTIRDVMTARVLCVRSEQTVDEAMALMTDKHVRHLPVLDEQKVVGVISMRDAVREVISEQQFVITQLENYITRP
ncbi:MAG: CBS domain-containing protein [Sandaracinaceae bacterium]